MFGYLQFLIIYLYAVLKINSCDVVTLVPNNSEFLVYLSVCWLAYFLTEITQIRYLQFWMRYLSEFFLRHFQGISRLFTDHFEFLVCLSVCWLAYFLTEIRQIQGYLLFWMTYLPKTFLRHSWDVCTLFPNACKFLVCLSVH